MQNNFFNQDRGFQRYSSASSSDTSSNLDTLLRFAQRAAADYQNAFQVASAFLQLDFHNTVPVPKKVLLLRYPDPENGKVYVSVYLPYKTDTIIDHVNRGHLIHKYLNHASNQQIIAQAFGDAADTCSIIAMGLVEPFPIDYSDTRTCADIVHHLLRAADARAEYERIKCAKDAAELKKLLPDFVDAEMQGGRFHIDYTFDADPITDVFGQPVRNDITLTLSFVSRPLRQATMEMASDTAEIITVSGYIDFRYMPEQAPTDRSWVPDTPYYIPEFVVTDIRYGIESAVVVLAPVLATLIVSEFMQAGLWYRRFESSYGDAAVNWLDLFALTRVTSEMPPRPTLNQVLDKMIGHGHVISFDVLTNPTVADMLALWAEGARGNHDVGELITECVSLAFTGQSSSYFERLAFMQYSGRLGEMGGIPIQIGTFQGPAEDQHDTREIDFLAVLNDPRRSVEDANRYQDSLFGPQSNGGRYGPHPAWCAEHDPVRTETQSQLAPTPIRYHNAAVRLTMDSGFVRLLNEFVRHGSVQFKMNGAKQSRPLVAPSLINDGQK